MTIVLLEWRPALLVVTRSQESWSEISWHSQKASFVLGGVAFSTSSRRLQTNTSIKSLDLWACGWTPTPASSPTLGLVRMLQQRATTSPTLPWVPVRRTSSVQPEPNRSTTSCSQQLTCKERYDQLKFTSSGVGGNCSDSYESNIINLLALER